MLLSVDFTSHANPIFFNGQRTHTKYKKAVVSRLSGSGGTHHRKYGNSVCMAKAGKEYEYVLEEFVIGTIAERIVVHE